MTLLDLLFPGIKRFETEGMPLWHDSGLPWSILSNEEGGLISQITETEGNDDGVFIHPTASIGEFVTIEGPCFIGPNAEIRHSAFLRGGSWICAGALVGNSTEVKNSVLLPEAKAPHFNYIGDSILDYNVNLGAGTKLSNVRNDRKDIFVTVKDGTRVNTGLRKLGAIIGDGGQLGCNVVTNPGCIISPGKMINPNEAVSGYIC